MEVFESRHITRDSEIPEQRRVIKEAIERDLCEDMDVIAVFYSGSIGNKDTDLYSDIDLRIVVRDEKFEEYKENKKKRAENWGDVLFFEDLPYVNYSTAHYEKLVKVNTLYYRLRDIMPSVRLQKIEIFFDESELLEDIVIKSNKMSFKPTVKDVELWRTKYFSYLHETYRRVMRDEPYYALHCLDNLRFSIVMAWFMEVGIQPNTMGDWAKVEGARTRLAPSQLEQLTSWHCAGSLSEIMNVAQQITMEFKRTHKILCEKVGLEENLEWVNKVLNKVL